MLEEVLNYDFIGMHHHWSTGDCSGVRANQHWQRHFQPRSLAPFINLITSGAKLLIISSIYLSLAAVVSHGLSSTSHSRRAHAISQRSCSKNTVRYALGPHATLYGPTFQRKTRSRFSKRLAESQSLLISRVCPEYAH